MKQQELKTEERDELGIAVHRSAAFTREIAEADSTTAKQLTAAWKEIIIESFLKAV